MVSPSNFSSLLSRFPGYKVSISGTTVVLTCPEEVEGENLQWEMNGEKIPEANEKQLSLDEFSEVEHSGYYACYGDASKKNYLYLKARGNTGPQSRHHGTP